MRRERERARDLLTGEEDRALQALVVHTVRERQPLPGQDLVPDGAEGGVADAGRDARNDGI